MTLYQKNGRDPITLEGRDTLVKELEIREGSKARSIANSLENAWDQGDERENEGFTIAFEQFNNNLQRIRIIKKILKETYLYIPNQYETVDIGHTVKLRVDEQEIEYKIVGRHESDILNGRLSVDSPIVRELINKKIGDIVILNTRKYIVVDIR